MDTIFDFAEACLQRDNITEKLQLTHLAWQKWEHGELNLHSSTPPAAIQRTVFPTRPILLLPKHMPNRSLASPEGLAAFFHALAHIEFIAVYLAWDILYRFRGLPTEFYSDWLRIAHEEAEHFALICTHLHSLGVEYGDLPAHHGLWEHAVDTEEDILARLAIVPRCMEARGLDVTPKMIAKFNERGDSAGAAILQRILTDEVGHVARGSYWFQTLCSAEGIDPDQHYQHLLQQYYKGGKPKGPFNRELRIIAGFSTAELDWLENGSL